MESCLASHSVADPGCLSRILIFTHHKYHKIKNYFIFEKLKKKVGPIFKELYNFTQKIVTKLSKKWVWDLGSGIRKNLFQIQDPGVKKAPDPRSQIPELAFKKCFLLFKGPVTF
jgi:hypothetical protein